MARFDLMALAGIALLALAVFEAYRNWDSRGLLLSLLLLALSSLQVLWLLRLMPTWGHLSVETWTVVLAGMVCCTSLGLLHTALDSYTQTAAALMAIVSFVQLAFGSGILKVH